MQSLEAQFLDTKIVDSLRKGEFTAPEYLQDRLEQQIKKLATLCEPLTFEVQEDAFCITAHEQSAKLLNIARQHRCLLEMQTSVDRRICQIPKAADQGHISNSLTAAAIEIRQEDLSEQKVTLQGHRVCFACENGFRSTWLWFAQRPAIFSTTL